MSVAHNGFYVVLDIRPQQTKVERQKSRGRSRALKLSPGYCLWDAAQGGCRNLSDELDPSAQPLEMIWMVQSYTLNLGGDAAVMEH
ncbi:hypothetical protein HPP92_029100 [Vanilla planifolia]|uniref:Uncharacterized protein n=1 Tax=Vanilla planifolia TaxID=51239 RepID=A0A835U2G8_VANPL|nr:hypothetical protein HPP92_029100 [Vanilla planifolia]KAG0445920.1 hypothetical protein HPP92_029089 [Vanilla planifolia]